MIAIDSLPTRKKLEKLEAKNSFLLKKANKLRGKVDEQKKQNQGILDKLNAALLFN